MADGTSLRDATMSDITDSSPKARIAAKNEPATDGEPNEVHGAKNPEAILDKASAALDAKAKILVSGTPMENRRFDASDILKIHPGCPFTTEKAFLRVLGANHFLLANALALRGVIYETGSPERRVYWGGLSAWTEPFDTNVVAALESANGGKRCGLLCPCAGVVITAGITLSVSLVVG
ncbi:hypothetical protein CGLO_15260 [Colletotrichum gloeosporioides Cg-14]|uniref:SNF2 N-terminal domain-containing protein n=1 Tax=Colletotrichum gloeosporioides (strain Cg-14) TaxID=1237896 RepID=T0L2F9_COLGC|nr:hypothetical protein CGLO_15260 [Colletotrichum gloeosporioides Cg-14]